MSDSTAVGEIIHTCCPNLDVSRIRSFRIGKFSQAAARPRPVRVALSTEADAVLVHRAFGGLRESRPAMLRGISVSFDRTPHQLQELKLLKAELRRRRERGENLRIVYRRGHPMIIMDRRSTVPQTVQQSERV